MILAPYACTSLSDSAVERSFSHADHRIPAQARSMSEASEGVRMTSLGMKAEQLPGLMPKATEVWGELYPPCRNGGFNRIDQGKSRTVLMPEKPEKPTERDFIKRRRLATSLATEAGAASHAPPAESEAGTALCGDAWTSRHSTECEFNRRKEHGRLIEAVVSNSLLDDEMDEELVTEAIDTLNKNTKNRAKRARREAKVASYALKGRIPGLDEFRGQSVFIADPGRTTDLDECIARYQWDMTTMEDASLIVTPELSEQMLHCAMLNGAWAVRPEWASALCHNTPYQGWAIKFIPATATRRLVWISPTAQEEQADAATAVRAAAARRGSRWRVAESLEDWVERKQTAKDQKNPASVIALVSDAEEQQFDNVGHVFNVVRFFEFVRNLDKAQTTLGLGNA